MMPISFEVEVIAVGIIAGSHCAGSRLGGICSDEMKLIFFEMEVIGMEVIMGSSRVEVVKVEISLSESAQ